MGLLLMDMGKLEEARPLYEEAVKGRKKTLGDRHPETLISIGNMGVLLKQMGKLEEARPLLEEALQAQREPLGDRHPETLMHLDLQHGQPAGRAGHARRSNPSLHGGARGLSRASWHEVSGDA